MRSPRRSIPVLVLLAGLTVIAAYIIGNGGMSDNASALPRLNREQVSRGQVLYTANCAACHGYRAEGQPDWKRPKVDGSYPAPPHDASGHTWHHGDGTLYQIIKDGGASLDIPNFRSNMPGFGETLSDEDIIAVLTYIKSLWPLKERQLQAEMSQQDPWPP